MAHQSLRVNLKYAATFFGAISWTKESWLSWHVGGAELTSKVNLHVFLGTCQKNSIRFSKVHQVRYSKNLPKTGEQQKRRRGRFSAKQLLNWIYLAFSKKRWILFLSCWIASKSYMFEAYSELKFNGALCYYPAVTGASFKKSRMQSLMLEIAILDFSF